MHHLCKLDTGNIQRMQEGAPEVQSDKLGKRAAKQTIRHGGPRDSQTGWQMVQRSAKVEGRAQGHNTTTLYWEHDIEVWIKQRFPDDHRTWQQFALNAEQ